ncbi:hypothetical protein [Bradyrhizobium sp. LTSPM299]|nr:hypothetical protein [Bradyrhizobium sp. LTSPM299]
MQPPEFGGYLPDPRGEQSRAAGGLRIGETPFQKFTGEQAPDAP